MSRSRQAVSQKPGWHIWVMSADGERLIFHGRTEDEKEVQALATEARSTSPRLKMHITDPYGRSYPWD